MSETISLRPSDIIFRGAVCGIAPAGVWSSIGAPSDCYICGICFGAISSGDICNVEYHRAPLALGLTGALRVGS